MFLTPTSWPPRIEAISLPVTKTDGSLYIIYVSLFPCMLVPHHALQLLSIFNSNSLFRPLFSHSIYLSILLFHSLFSLEIFLNKFLSDTISKVAWYELGTIYSENPRGLPSPKVRTNKLSPSKNSSSSRVLFPLTYFTIVFHTGSN